MTVKPGQILRINRAAAARTRTSWFTAFQDHGVVRDLIGGQNVPVSGTRIVAADGSALSFDGSQGSQGAARAWPAANRLAFIARVRANNASQPASPGAVFGVYAATGGQGGIGIGFNGLTVGAAWLHSNGAGLAAPVTIAANVWYTVIVQGSINDFSGTLQRTWVGGVGKTSVSPSAGAADAPLDTVVLGAQYRSSGFLRNGRADIAWAGILVGDRADWMTDDIAAELFASDYPRTLIDQPKRSALWGGFVASGPVARTVTSGLTAVLQRAASASMSFSTSLQAGRNVTAAPGAAVLAGRSSAVGLSAGTLASVAAQEQLSLSVQQIRAQAASVGAAIGAVRSAAEGLQASVAVPVGLIAGAGAAIERPQTAGGLLSAVTARNAASTLLMQVLAQAKTATAVGADLQVRVGFASSIGLLLGVRAGVSANAGVDVVAEVARARQAVGSAAVRAAVRAMTELSLAAVSTRSQAAYCDGYVSVANAAGAGMSAVIEGDSGEKLAALSAALQSLISAAAGMELIVAQAQTAALGLQACLASQQIADAAMDATVDAGAVSLTSVGAYVYDPGAIPVPARILRRWVIARELRRWVLPRQPRSWRVKG